MPFGVKVGMLNIGNLRGKGRDGTLVMIQCAKWGNT